MAQGVRLSLGALLFFCRADHESALRSPASEPDSQSGRFYNACPILNRTIAQSAIFILAQAMLKSQVMILRLLEADAAV